ncbi:SWIM zinc finger domain-containing protein [Paenibacillus sp. KQZ6P-2]|uniref:SWIM zinc finger domain-containing protein n=1 Tax=Paenibacillus mangrovi TaxID=2931978 RepID=A0A9X1WV14_9BACL|nr:SWIM zinc finger family protein [Paenibacillus mangrovi]MCJ8014255.1 SWIM zinc finger domain-containing protein [Paenibacillus mangrovi]
MVEITETWIDSLAPNSAAIKNGHDLIKKGKFTAFHQSEDELVLFGICAGSGKTPYTPSADFVFPDKPVMRCSCPSRQIPCKHVLGLLYAYSDGKPFSTEVVPDELAAKREKAEKREEKKAKEAAEGTAPKTKKVNKSALKKKIMAQLQGLDVLEKLTFSLIRRGLGTLDAKELKIIQEHVKQMGSFYLNGAQIQLRKLHMILSAGGNPEYTYSFAAEQFAVIHAFIKKGRAHLNAKLEDPELALDHESTIEEWLGHAWQLSELKEARLVSPEAELIQLSFLSYDDASRLEFVDNGYWMQMDSGEIHSTVQYRPYKAAKLMREEDSFFEVARVPALYRYPGDMNRRVRYESFTSRPLEEQDIAQIRQYAAGSYIEAIKKVKNQLKNPLGDPNPVMLLHVDKVVTDEEGRLFIADAGGDTLGLQDVIGDTTVQLVKYLPEDSLKDIAMLVLFDHQPQSGQLRAQPLSIVNKHEIIRLLY